MKFTGLVLLFSVSLLAWAQSQNGPTIATQKTIKDPTEYNAYMNAISATYPNAKAQSFEAFLQQYPNTVVKEETLEQLMAAYQGSNSPKTTDAANRLLQVNPNNIRGLAVMTFLTRAQNNYSDAAKYAQRGLVAPLPAGMANADFKKLQDGLRVIFKGAIGMEALQRKDYPTAQKALSAAISVPEDATNLNDVYPLACAYLQASPPDYQNGLVYGARSVSLAQGNSAAQQTIRNFVQYYYRQYHGSDEGWLQFLDTAKNTTPPPPSAGNPSTTNSGFVAQQGVPSGYIHSIAYSVVPQQRTTYYQSGQQSSQSNCYASSNTFGSFGTIDMTCDTRYSNPTQIPITWQYADVYNLVETSTQRLVVGCRATWRWSKCTPLIPGATFEAEVKGQALEVTYYKDADAKKKAKVRFQILQANVR